MDSGDFSFETLSKQESLERKQPRLTKLEPTFWDGLQTYLRTLESNLRKEAERNPTSRKIALLQDELRNATRKTESLWEAREKKITLYALKNSRDAAAVPPENSLAAERQLYEDLTKTFRSHVPRVVQLMEKSSEAPTLTPVAPRAAAQPAAAPTPPAPAAPVPMSKPGEEVLTVRALADVPPFVGLDGKTYRLKKGDVLTLPRKMVDVLAKRGQVDVIA